MTVSSDERKQITLTVAGATLALSLLGQCSWSEAGRLAVAETSRLGPSRDFSLDIFYQVCYCRRTIPDWGTGDDMAVNIIKAIDQGIANKPSQHWPRYDGGVLDRTQYVTASEVGYCERKVWLDKEALRASGYKPEAGTVMPADWGMLERGHNIEAWAVEQIRRGTNYELLYAGNEQVSFASDYQAATPDGVFKLEDGSYQLEVKSIDPRTNWNNLPKPVHVDQVMQAADLVSYSMDLPPIGGMLIYIDASNYKKRTQFHLPFDPDHANRLQDRAERIMKCNDPAELQPEGMYKDHCKWCAHTARCGALNATERTEVMKDGKIEELSKQLFG